MQAQNKTTQSTLDLYQTHMASKYFK